MRDRKRDRMRLGLLMRDSKKRDGGISARPGNRSLSRIFLWAYIWLMSFKLALDWASLLSELVQLFHFAALVVRWWRSLYYPVFLHLGLRMPHWTMDVLGAGFALGNIAAALMAIKSRSINPEDSVGRFAAIIFTFLHYIRGFHFVVRDIARRNLQKALGRYRNQPLPYILSTLINLAIAAVMIGVISFDIAIVKWSLVALLYSLILIVIFVAWIAASFDVRLFGRQYRNVYPIRWITGVLATAYILGFLFAEATRLGILDWLEKNKLI